VKISDAQRRLLHEMSNGYEPFAEEVNANTINALVRRGWISSWKLNAHATWSRSYHITDSGREAFNATT
jgi:DNA-binding PadR family transcriptional regulator